MRDPAPVSAEIIDVRFKVVGRKRRVLGVIWRALVAVFWAALIGFLVPPAWAFFQYLSSLLAGS